MKQWFRFETQKGVELMRLLLPGAEGVFSTRNGGVSAAPFDTLNLAFHVGDAPEAVTVNRQVFAAAAGFSLDKLVCGQQVHGTRISSVSPGYWGRGAYSYEDALPDTDGLITNQRDTVLGTFYADCVPVYIADPVQRAVGLAHAGWKGTVNGIAGKTVARMTEEFGCVPGDCFAFIGPSIGPCCYRVGEEVVALLDSKMATHVSQPSGGHLGKRRPGEQIPGQSGEPQEYKLDLWGANRDNLIAAGLAADKISVCGICSQCHPKFFSFRRDGGRTGRMGAFIKLI